MSADILIVGQQYLIRVISYYSLQVIVSDFSFLSDEFAYLCKNYIVCQSVLYLIPEKLFCLVIQRQPFNVLTWQLSVAYWRDSPLSQTKSAMGPYRIWKVGHLRWPLCGIFSGETCNILGHSVITGVFRGAAFGPWSPLVRPNQPRP